MRMLGFYLLFFLLHTLCLPAAGQEGAISVSVSPSDLPVISSSLSAAEGWLKTHVLVHSPFKKISTIEVGRGVLCSSHHFVLPSVRNLHYSLERWGLLREIKVSAIISSVCLQNPSSDLFSNHRAALERMDLSGFRGVRAPRETKPISRKLSSPSFPSFPETPKPSEFIAPDTAAGNPIPPPLQFAPVPDGSFSFVPDVSPAVNPPDVAVVPPPPCPAAERAPAPGAGEEQKGGLWCVAKPAVPDDKLQEAMDYACGVGGGNCAEIRPNGSCFSPDSVVAHASYAFNSYWQKTKQSGGSCSFGGTALLINSDPSFLQCRFELD